MPEVVRLPAHVKKGEVRAYWDVTPEGRGIFVDGGPARSIVLDALCSSPIEPGPGGSLTHAFVSGAIRTGKSMVDKLEEEGYDPATLVFSIMRKDAPPSAPMPAADLRSRLEKVQSQLVRLRRVLDMEDDHKCVYVLDQSEMEDLREIASECGDSVGFILDALQTDG